MTQDILFYFDNQRIFVYNSVIFEFDPRSERLMVFDKVKEIIKDELGFNTEGLTLASTLTDMGADSLDAVELIMALEEAYDIEISEADAVKMTSLGSIVSYIESKK